MKNIAILAILLIIAGCTSYTTTQWVTTQQKTTTTNAVTTAQGDNMKPIVVFETTLGNFEVELDNEKAPISSKNFLSYVNDGFYEGLIFHRVINGFMVQGGGMDKDMKEKANKAPIKNEAGNGLKNNIYTIAMARTGVVDSATSQFFVNVANNDFLNHVDETARGFGYAVFGKVVSGTDTIDKMKIVETTSVGPNEDVPVTAIVVNKAYLKK